MKNKLHSIQKLPFLIPLFVIIVTITGILNQNIYSGRLNSITASEILGQDSVSLIISIIFFVCLLFERQSFFLKTVNLGILSYFIYIYSYYCFSIISSTLFLIYIVIFGLSLFIFIFRLSALIKENSLINSNSHYPRKTISVFFIIAVLIMLIKELPYLIDITIIKNKSTTLFDAYYILDLAIVFPAMIIIATMNLLNKPSCVFFSGIVLVKLITLMPALLFNDIFHFMQKGYFLDISFVIIAFVFTTISLMLLYFYKRGIKT
jgi:hypothetical protein